MTDNEYRAALAAQAANPDDYGPVPDVEDIPPFSRIMVRARAFRDDPEMFIKARYIHYNKPYHLVSVEGVEWGQTGISGDKIVGLHKSVTKDSSSLVLALLQELQRAAGDRVLRWPVERWLTMEDSDAELRTIAERALEPFTVAVLRD